MIQAFERQQRTLERIKLLDLQPQIKNSYLVSERNYHTTKWFSKIILETEMNKTKVKLNKTIYFGLSILEICKAAIHGFWYDSIKPKYQDKSSLWYMDKDSL